MNPLEKHPHLFANGKFKAMYRNDIYLITGFNKWLREDNWKLTYSLFNKDKMESLSADISETILIARPISDMTDEELNPVVGMMGFEDMTYEEWFADREDFFLGVATEGSFRPEKDIEDVIENFTEATMYALSIGVYPFDQSHFEDGTVINATEKQPL